MQRTKPVLVYSQENSFIKEKSWKNLSGLALKRSSTFASMPIAKKIFNSFPRTYYYVTISIIRTRTSSMVRVELSETLLKRDS